MKVHSLKCTISLGRGEHSYFNNEYYKSLTKPTDYLIAAPFNQFALIGGTDGGEARVTWKVGGRGWNTDGGPYLWTKNQAYFCMPQPRLIGKSKD